MTFESLSNNSLNHPSLKLSRKISDLALHYSVDIIQAFDPIPLMEAYASQFWHKKPLDGLITAQATPKFKPSQHQEIALVNPDTIARFKQRWGWDPEKLRLLVARLDCDFYRPQSDKDDQLFSRFPLQANAPILSLISRIDNGKWETIEMFLSAANHWQKTRRQNQSINFFIVGSGKLFPELLTKIQELGLSNYVFAIGERLDIPEVLNASSVVIGMASTCQQGLACGRPVIVVGDNGYSELIEPGNFDFLAGFHFNLHILSSNNPPEHLCKLIEKVLDFPQYAIELSKFSRRIACERYDSRIGAEHLVSAYKYLLDNPQVKWTSNLIGYKTFIISWLSLQYVSFHRKLKRRWLMFLG